MSRGVISPDQHAILGYPLAAILIAGPWGLDFRSTAAVGGDDRSAVRRRLRRRNARARPLRRRRRRCSCREARDALSVWRRYPRPCRRRITDPLTAERIAVQPVHRLLVPAQFRELRR